MLLQVMPFFEAFPLEQFIWLGIAAAAAIAMFIIVGVFLRLRARRVRQAVSRSDLYAVVIDLDDNTVKMQKFVKIETGTYAAIDTDSPLFMVVPAGVNIYRCYHGKQLVPCVAAISHDTFVTPIDPVAMAKASYMQHMDRGMKVDEESAVKFFEKMIEQVEAKIGKVQIASPTPIAIAFDIPKMFKEISGQTAAVTGDTILYVFRAVKNIEAFERYIRSVERVAAARMSKYLFIAIVIIAIGIVAVLILQTLPTAIPAVTR